MCFTCTLFSVSGIRKLADFDLAYLTSKSCVQCNVSSTQCSCRLAEVFEFKFNQPEERVKRPFNGTGLGGEV